MINSIRLFEIVSFPVVTTDARGVVQYKNPAAIRALPGIRRGASLLRHLFGHALTVGTAYLADIETAYPHALTLQDGEHFILLFFSRLQYADGEEIASEIHSRYAGDVHALMADLAGTRWSMMASAPSAPVFRVEADMLRLFREELTDDSIRFWEPFPLLQAIANRVNGAFRALGYRIHMELSGSLQSAPPIRLALSDFLFWFGKFLYVQMKLSATKMITITAKADPATNVPVLSVATRTSLSRARVESHEALPMLASLVPECAAEFEIFAERPALSDLIHLRVDRYGKLILEYPIPTKRTGTFSVRSIECNMTGLSAALDVLVHSICRDLRCNTPR